MKVLEELSHTSRMYRRLPTEQFPQIQQQLVYTQTLAVHGRLDVDPPQIQLLPSPKVSVGIAPYLTHALS